MLPNLILFHQGFLFPASYFPRKCVSGIWDSRRLILPVRTDAKRALSTAGFSCILCHWDPGHIQQSAHIFPGPPFPAEVRVEAFLIALHKPAQIQFLVGFGIPRPMPASLASASVFLLGHLSLLLCLVCIPFIAELSQEQLVHPCRLPAAFPWFPAHQGGPLEEVIFDNETGAAGKENMSWMLNAASHYSSASVKGFLSSCH